MFPHPAPACGGPSASARAVAPVAEQRVVERFGEPRGVSAAPSTTRGSRGPSGPSGPNGGERAVGGA